MERKRGPKAGKLYFQQGYQRIKLEKNEEKIYIKMALFLLLLLM